MPLSDATRSRLASLKADLRREFSGLPADRVDQLVEDVVAELLEQAQFDDFVPLLAGRRVRERLAAEATA